MQIITLWRLSNRGQGSGTRTIRPETWSTCLSFASPDLGDWHVHAVTSIPTHSPTAPPTSLHATYSTRNCRNRLIHRVCGCVALSYTESDTRRPYRRVTGTQRMSSEMCSFGKTISMWQSENYKSFYDYWLKRKIFATYDGKLLFRVQYNLQKKYQICGICNTIMLMFKIRWRIEKCIWHSMINYFINIPIGIIFRNLATCMEKQSILINSKTSIFATGNIKKYLAVIVHKRY